MRCGFVDRGMALPTGSLRGKRRKKRKGLADCERGCFLAYWWIEMFELVSSYQPAGDQPQAIAKLTEGMVAGRGIRRCSA